MIRSQRPLLPLMFLTEKIKSLTIQFFSLLIMIYISVSASADSIKELALNHSYAGNVSFELAAGSFLSGDSDDCTVNSESDGWLTGNIPDDAIILDAYIFWSASYDPNGKSSDIDPNPHINPDTQVTLNTVSLNATASNSYFANQNLGAHFYGGKAQALSVVGSTGLEAKKRYTLTDLDVYKNYGNGNGNGNENSDCEIVLGGWSLVVVYEHDDLPFQVTNIFDGYKPVFSNTGEIILRLSNFIVAPNPTGKHAHITFEGDPELGSTKENLKFQGTLLTDTYNQAHAQFNSVSNIYAGSTHSTDTLGVDVDAYDISSYLSPGNTFVETSYETGGDTVLLMAEVISVSNFPVADLEVKTTAPQPMASEQQCDPKVYRHQ